MLEGAGFDVTLINAPAAGLDRQATIEKIKQLRPDLLVCETSTSSIENDIEVIRVLKNVGVPFVSLNIDPDNVISRHTLGVVVSTKTDIENLGNNYYRMAQLLLPQAEHLLKNGTIRRDIEENARRYVIKKHSSIVVVPQLCRILQSNIS